jgi:hypothetical protein
LNKDKRPLGFVVKSNKDESGEKAAAMIDDVNNLQEYLLGTMDNSDVINNQNLWIADLAATVHMTPYRNGLKNIKKVDNIGTITMGNGTKERITEVADVLGTISVRNKMKRVRIQDVTILKNGKFNLFSLSQMLKKGWKLTGNNEYIAISKGDLEIRFDQKVPTNNGVLYGIQIARDDEFCGRILDAQPVKMTLIDAHGKLGHMSFLKAKQVEINWVGYLLDLARCVRRVRKVKPDKRTSSKLKKGRIPCKMGVFTLV